MGFLLIPTHWIAVKTIKDRPAALAVAWGIIWISFAWVLGQPDPLALSLARSIPAALIGGLVMFGVARRIRKNPTP
jgi:hypothetical protein